MTITLLFLISLFINGVVTDDSMSVYEGDSVTLHTDLTDIQTDHLINWRFGDQQDLIAKINRADNNSLRIYDDVLDGIFRDRLQVNNQTGDLIITNITTQHNGLYQLEIIRGKITKKTFNINVSGDKVKTVAVGDSVILVNNVTKKPGDEKMVLRIRHNNSPVAEIIGTVLTYNVNGERFRDRLKVDDHTGDLIIRDITTDDSGSFEVDIIVGSHTYTIHRSFSIPVKDEKMTVVSGLCAFIQAELMEVKKIEIYTEMKHAVTQLPVLELIGVNEEESADLKTDLTDIQRVDLIEWRFKETLIAEINPANNIFSTYDGDNNKFRGKLKLNPQTGDLNINDIREKHTGGYKLKIIRDGETSHKFFSVFVKSAVTGETEELTVYEGESVHLKTKITDIQTDDVIEWTLLSEDCVIANINPANNIFSTCKDSKFKDRLHLDLQTGDLIIDDITWGDRGHYTLKIITDGETYYRSFLLAVTWNRLFVDKGFSADLKTDLTDIQRDDVIEWRFGESLIAKINPVNNIFSTYDGDKGLFRDKLKLNPQTGDLTINDFREEHKGGYKLKIIRGGQSSYKRFTVSFGVTKLEVDEGKSINLKTEFKDIQRVDLIEWRFVGTLIAEINPANNIFITYDKGLFRDKLKLNHQTGDLNISDFREELNGIYTLKIIRDVKTLERILMVSVRREREVKLNMNEGESVDLDTYLNDIKRDDVIEWRFNETLIAEINPANNISRTYDGNDDLFRGKLKLNLRTGDLKIKNFREKHEGVYKLKIIRDGETSLSRFIVSISDAEDQN
ncbi:uncharacterized protein [Paramisgurnus dabryanus]|uniref:uncharacterized protein isoform X2 n=1 Tax=Paramisgurnus dabryanus TaxID=90735 RepID=UPI0031F42DBB